jgi:hypothetical protein
MGIAVVVDTIEVLRLYVVPPSRGIRDVKAHKKIAERCSPISIIEVLAGAGGFAIIIAVDTNPPAPQLPVLWPFSIVVCREQIFKLKFIFPERLRTSKHASATASHRSVDDQRWTRGSDGHGGHVVGSHRSVWIHSTHSGHRNDQEDDRNGRVREESMLKHHYNEEVDMLVDEVETVNVGDN